MGVSQSLTRGMQTLKSQALSAALLPASLGLGMIGCGQAELPHGKAPILSVSTPPQRSIPAPDPAAVEAARLLEQGKLAEALVAVDKSVTAVPSASALALRAAIHLKLGQHEQAVADFTSALQLDPNNARYLNNRGFLWLSQKEFGKALADFDAAIASQPDYANAHNNRALLQIAQGRHRQAILDLDRALQCDPNYTDAYNNRGFAQMQLERWDRALADFNVALKLQPRELNALANRGFVKMNLGDTAGAITDFTSVMLLDPDNPKYYEHRREAYLRDGSLEKAQEDAAKIELLWALNTHTQAIAQRPYDPEAYLQRGKKWKERGAEDRALADFTKCLELAPSHIDAHLQRALILVSQKEYAAAMADCEAILKQEDHQQAYSLRGDCRLELKDLDGALADFEAAKRLDSRVAQAYLLKGDELSRKGDVQAAADFRARAESLDFTKTETTPLPPATIQEIP